MPEFYLRMWRALLALLVVLAALAPRQALAYPWMIKHGYTNCAQCHIDPSGGGTLTEYGRAQGEILVRTHYEKTAADQTPGKIKDFAFGAVTLPKPLSLQADLRGLVIPEPGNVRTILMQADVSGAVQAGIFTAAGSIGPVSEGGEAAWLTQNTAPNGWNLVSRDYWVGVTPMKGLLIRAGRIQLPFGIRSEDHELYVRNATRTDGNDQQQTGVAASYTSKKFRAEVMGIAGNFSVSPDVFRERGYSLYGSYAIKKTFELGISSLVTEAQEDIITLAPLTRQVHGVYTRASPVKSVAILAEADLMLDKSPTASTTGIASSAMVDWEPAQGLHVMGIGQYCNPDLSSSAAPAWTGGGAVEWFLVPRLDIRVDAFDGMLTCAAGGTPQGMGLLQAHFYL